MPTVPFISNFALGADKAPLRTIFPANFTEVTLSLKHRYPLIRPPVWEYSVPSYKTNRFFGSPSLPGFTFGNVFQYTSPSSAIKFRRSLEKTLPVHPIRVNSHERKSVLPCLPLDDLGNDWNRYDWFRIRHR